MDADPVAATISEYARHGWVLRRALVSSRSYEALFPGVEVIGSDIDALWFSRSSRPDTETWELRRIGGAPYALDVFLDDAMDDEVREEILSDTEARMRATKIVFSGN